jgi:predicted RNA binding protein YcfA (HicA-like mRNA interferase family)
MNPRRLLERLAGGSFNNVGFADAQQLVLAFGFRLVRTEGSHHIYVHPDVPVLLNLQNVRGEAKPYQLRQMVRLAERYRLSLERER